MRKEKELANPNSCLNKAARDEMLFVLRSQDESAPMMVRLWATINYKTLTPEKYREAMDCATAMEIWQENHPDKVKKPD